MRVIPGGLTIAADGRGHRCAGSGGLEQGRRLRDGVWTHGPPRRDLAVVLLHRARKYADGTSKGELQLNSRSFDVVVYIKIDCLRVVGNVAHMSGGITRVSNPDEGEAGELNRVEVRDNGEASKAPPDQVSTIPVNPGNADSTTCVGPPTNTTIRTVQRGNVQVRG